MALPPVEVVLATEGLSDTLRVFDKLEERLKVLETMSERSAKKAAKAQGDEASRGAERARKEAEKLSATKQREEDKITAQKRKMYNSLFKEEERREKETARNRERFLSDWKKGQKEARKESDERFAFKQKVDQYSLGSTAARGGVAAVGVVAALGLVSALALASEALTQFGGFVIHDIIGAQLKLGTKSTQIGNQIGADRGAVRGTINALSKGSIQSDETVQNAFSTAAGITGNLDHARQVTKSSLELADVFGLDANAMAKFLGERRRALPGLNEEQFNAMSVLQFRRLQDPKTRGNFGKIAEMGGLLDNFAGKFGESDAEKARHTIGLTGLLGYASTRGKGEGFDDMIRQTMSDFEDPSKGLSGIAKIPGTNLMRSLDQVLPVAMQKAGGNQQWFKNAGFGEGTRKLLFETLGLDKVYQTAERKKAGSGSKAVEEFMKDIMSVKGSRSLEAEKANLEADPGAQWEALVKRIKTILIEKFVPLFEEKIMPAFMKLAPQIETFTEKFSEALTDMLDLDFVGIFKAIASGLGTALYYVLAVAQKTGLVKVSDKSLASLKKAAGVDEFEENVEGKKNGGKAGEVFDTVTTAAMFTPFAAMALISKGVARAVRGGATDDVKLDSEGDETFKQLREQGLLGFGLSSDALVKAIQENSQVTRENSQMSEEAKAFRSGAERMGSIAQRLSFS